MKAIRINLKDKSIWLWITLPLLMNLLCILLATTFLPEFMEHLAGRTERLISFNQLALLILQLAILALGEEIAWRGFFQKQVSKWLPILPTLMVTSLLFSIAHFTVGDMVVVSYDLFFIFINSMLYGIVFHKTNNAWISAFSHFIANLSVAFLLFFM
ncbi:CPBP family intramembrane glutamic endopeptidase [Sporosarcina obsidiansis]|uniref:CPBP family intramembrane glutamic endopeptidase n=1 Tax=Sporosarcina obsidiansis TaxID=2660748 RepID=UPI00129B765E|nr:CPBP family intramembrane glutamic endopeptidase [Sporosarcina obsidiansis]